MQDLMEIREVPGGWTEQQMSHPSLTTAQRTTQEPKGWFSSLWSLEKL